MIYVIELFVVAFTQMEWVRQNGERPKVLRITSVEIMFLA